MQCDEHRKSSKAQLATACADGWIEEFNSND